MREDRELVPHRRDIGHANHGGRMLEEDFDYGHQGKDLNAFCNAKESKVAGLSRANVLALRLCASLRR